MSIFAKIKSTKKAADEHKAATAAKAAQEAAEASKPQPATAYHHVPRHAAQDALAGTPGVADVAAIREANQTRVMYASENFYSTSSPSLNRSYSSDGVVSLRSVRNSGGFASGSASMSRSSSRAGNLTPRHASERRTHPGYHSYQSSFSVPSPQRSRRGSSGRNSQPKSPLSSEPITPLDSSASASSSSSFSSTRSYRDPIEPSAPFSQRLEGLGAVQKATVPRTPLYVPKTTSMPKPWEVQAASVSKKAEGISTTVTEIKVQAPAPTAQPVKRSRFMGFKGKQQAVAAC